MSWEKIEMLQWPNSVLASQWKLAWLWAKLWTTLSVLDDFSSISPSGFNWINYWEKDGIWYLIFENLPQPWDFLPVKFPNSDGITYEFTGNYRRYWDKFYFLLSKWSREVLIDQNWDILIWDIIEFEWRKREVYNISLRPECIEITIYINDFTMKKVYLDTRTENFEIDLNRLSSEIIK